MSIISLVSGVCSLSLSCWIVFPIAMKELYRSKVSKGSGSWRRQRERERGMQNVIPWAHTEKLWDFYNQPNSYWLLYLLEEVFKDRGDVMWWELREVHLFFLCLKGLAELLDTRLGPTHTIHPLREWQKQKAFIQPSLTHNLFFFCCSTFWSLHR